MCLAVTYRYKSFRNIGAGAGAGIAASTDSSHNSHNYRSIPTMKRASTKTTIITPRSTESTTADDSSTSSYSSGSDSKDASNIFRTPKEFDSSTFDNKVDDVLKLSPPPLLVLPGSEESIVDESFDMNSILLKNKSKKFLAQIKYRDRMNQKPQQNAPTTEFQRVFFTESVPVNEDSTPAVKAILHNPMIRTVYVRVTHCEDSNNNSSVGACIYSTEQVKQIQFVSPICRRSRIIEQVLVVITFDVSWDAATVSRRHRGWIQDLKVLLRSLITEYTVIQLVNAPMVIRVVWNVALRWHFREAKIGFLANDEDTAEQDDIMMKFGSDLRAVTKPIMHGGVLSNGYVSERIKV